jgi:glycosyltransferase involved in cell wall biosynthesis
MSNLSCSRIAVLIPCYNEEVAIKNVVEDFKKAIPSAIVYVYDNNSTDNTVSVAKKAGAIVRFEPLQGKGLVVRRMFADIEADVYVLTDGDDTYDASVSTKLISLLQENQLDMVNAARESVSEESYRSGHRFGNWLLTSMVSWIFGQRFSDMLSGYRVFSRRYVKSFPAEARGFEIETELTVHALQLHLPVAEVFANYKERPVGSISKLSTFKDGFRILSMIILLIKSERPFLFFSVFSLIFALSSFVLALPLIETYLLTGLVPRMPTAVLIVGLMILAAISFACGLILDTVTRGRREMRRLAYLQQPAPLSTDA